MAGLIESVPGDCMAAGRLRPPHRSANKSPTSIEDVQAPTPHAWKGVVDRCLQPERIRISTQKRLGFSRIVSGIIMVGVRDQVHNSQVPAEIRSGRVVQAR